MKKIRVMIVEDSPTVRELLKIIINNDSRLEVVSAVESGEVALKVLDSTKPDVISMDIRLPGINGFETTRMIMASRPTPIVVVSASVEAEDLNISMNALRAGALSVVEKPVGFANGNFEKISQTICTQLAIMSDVRVVRQRVIKRPDSSYKEQDRSRSCDLSRNNNSGQLYEILGITASTGGPNALCEVLGNLPGNFALPVLLVQHIEQSFTEGFVSWLSSVCPFSAVMVKEEQVPLPGRIYVASPDYHLVVDKGMLSIKKGDPVCLQRPSGNVLFRSMAESFGRRALGVLLTGMGEDGAEGLKFIKNAGGYTFVEDESTAVVFGMPKAAIQMDAACEVVPLQKIASRILDLTNFKGR